tara:strand:- start:56 stop:247 length:192 start_codon:yes stop_codon:yes gene_type:complete
MTYHNVKIDGYTGNGETRSKALSFQLDGLIIDHDDLYNILESFNNAFSYDAIEIEVSFDTSNV